MKLQNNQIVVELNPKQLQTWKLITDNQNGITDILFGGGAGGGKSWLGSFFLLMYARMYPGIRLFLAGEELKNLKETTLVTFFDLCNFFGLNANVDYKYNPITGIITFINRSTITLLSLKYQPSDPEFNFLGSSEYTAGFIDQAEKITYKAYQTIRTRIRYKNDFFNLKPVLLLSCNPSDNWLYTHFYLPYKTNKLEKHKAFIQALVFDNPKIDSNYIDILQKTDERIKRRLLYGDWDFNTRDNQLIPVLSFENALVENYDFRVYSKQKIGVDIARTGGDSTILAHVIDNVLYDIIEFKQNINSETDISGEIAAWIIEYCSKHKIGYEDVNVDATGLGAGVVDACRRMNFYVNEFIGSSAAPKQNSFYNFTNLRDFAYWNLRLKLQQEDLKVNKNIYLLERFRREILAHEYNIENDGSIKILSKEEIKRKIGHSPDASDAVVMALVDIEKTQKRVISVKTNLYG